MGSNSFQVQIPLLVWITASSWSKRDSEILPKKGDDNFNILGKFYVVVYQNLRTFFRQ